MENKKYIVHVDDNFNYMDENCRSQYGEYETYEEAVKICKSIVDYHLTDLSEQNKNRGEELDAEQLYSYYTTFGEDPWITPEPEGEHFSAWEYAKARAKELTIN